MPVVPSPNVAVEAAVGPAPTKATEAASEAAPTLAEALGQTLPEAGASAEHSGQGADGAAADPPDAPQSVDESAGEGEALASAEQTPPEAEAEPEPPPAKPWWNPTGGGSDDPDRDDDTPM